MRTSLTRRRRNGVIGFALSAAALVACNAVDAVRNGFEHSKAVSARLEKSVGRKSAVGFNWQNGALTSVNVRFDGLPEDRSLAQIAELSREAVRREFKQAPKHLVVSFSIEP